MQGDIGQKARQHGQKLGNVKMDAARRKGLEYAIEKGCQHGGAQAQRQPVYGQGLFFVFL